MRASASSAVTGRAAIGAAGKAVVMAPPGLPNPPESALKITYRFEPGWKFVRVAPTTVALKKIDGQPRRFGVWIFGDGHGNIPRLRFVDATGQTFQPDGEPITWTGWRYAVFPMDGTHAGHWGGADDGVIHYPIAWDSLFLLDSAKRGGTAGTVYIAGPMLIR